MDIVTWLSSSAIASAVAILASSLWERRKLSRTERATAYADFISIFSRRWKAFADRDGAKKRGDSSSEMEFETRIKELREDLYDAYSRIQILGSQEVVEKALACVRISDDRNRAFKNPDAPGVGVDTKASALAALIRASRSDLHLRPLETDRLKPGFTSRSGSLLLEE